MNTADLAIAALGVNGLASLGTVVYVVRRVSPWPKPPAVSGQSQGTTRTAGGHDKASAVNNSAQAAATAGGSS